MVEILGVTGRVVNLALGIMPPLGDIGGTPAPRLAAVERGSDGSAATTGTGRAPRLPRMAEGWGS